MSVLIPTAADFFDRYELCFKLSSHIHGYKWQRRLIISDVQRLSLALSRCPKDRQTSTLFVFGKAEFDHLRSLTVQERDRYVRQVVTVKTPMIIVADKLAPMEQLVALCRDKKVLLLCSQLSVEQLLVALSRALAQDFYPCFYCHGTLVEVYGLGVMIEGEAGIGKSETALGLVANGHRLIADDRVLIWKKKDNQLIGNGVELNRHLLEMRGIGVVNVNDLYGAGCVRDEMAIDLVIRLEKWENHHFDDAIGLEERFRELLGVKTPFCVLPVKAGRNLTLLTEAIVLNHRAKSMGHHAAKEFHFKLSREIARQE